MPDQDPKETPPGGAPPDPKPPASPDPKPPAPEPKADPKPEEDPDWLKKRLAREERTTRERAQAEFVARYGVKTPEELDAKLKAADELAKAEEARRRAQLTEQERLAADLAAANAKIAERDAKIREYEDARAADEAGQQFAELARKHVKPGKVDWALMGLRDHIAAKVKADPAAEFTDKDAERWLRQLPIRDPDFAIAPAAKPPPARKPITTGADPAGDKPPAKPAPYVGPHVYKGKIALPGYPNSMNKEELAEFARSQGIRHAFGRGADR